jgi:hypothetical protein
VKLTREQIENMPAGRDMDALVAEEFGWDWDDTRCRVCGWPLHETADDGCVPGNCSMRPRPEHMADRPAPFSTSLTAAWLLIEKFQGGEVANFEPGGWFWPVEIDRLPDSEGPGRGGWVVTLAGHEGSAPTFPLSVCRAALLSRLS